MASISRRREPVASALALFERDIGVAEPHATEERHHPSNRLELADLDIVESCARARSDQQFFHTLVADRSDNPQAIPRWPFLEGVCFAHNLCLIAALDQVSESGFRNHIRRFFF